MAPMKGRVSLLARWMVPKRVQLTVTDSLMVVRWALEMVQTRARLWGARMVLPKEQTTR